MALRKMIIPFKNFLKNTVISSTQMNDNLAEIEYSFNELYDAFDNRVKSTYSKEEVDNLQTIMDKNLIEMIESSHVDNEDSVNNVYNSIEELNNDEVSNCVNSGELNTTSDGIITDNEILEILGVEKHSMFNLDMGSFENDSVVILDGGTFRETLPEGETCKEIELRKGSEYLEWRYIGENTWRKLIAIKDLKGEVDTTNYYNKSEVDEKVEYHNYKDIVVLKNELERSLLRIREHHDFDGDDTYTSFAELSLVEKEEVDYSIRYEDKADNFMCIFTPHGGGIEPGSTEVVLEVAGDTYNSYRFNGIKSSDNASLHITSTNFDEPSAVYVVGISKNALSIHGYASETSNVTLMGGRNTTLRNLIKKELTKSGFPVEDADHPLSGKKSTNIVNRCITKQGIQLELPTHLRKTFFVNNDLSSSGRKNKTQAFYDYCNALKRAINRYNENN